MNIIVLVKQVPDPEGVYSLDGEGNIQSADLPRLLSVFDENALEAALQLQEEVGASVTALTYGVPESDKSLLHALAMGANEAVLIEDDASDERDCHTVASILAAAIRKLGGTDLVLAGRESSDAGNGLVGPLVAQLLDLPFLTLVTKLEVVDGGFRLTRLAEGGHDVYDASSPLLVSVSSEMNFPRYPSVMKFLQAKKKPLRRWRTADLDVDLSRAASGQLRLLRRYQPQLLGNCKFAGGETIETQVDALLSMLEGEV